LSNALIFTRRAVTKTAAKVAMGDSGFPSCEAAFRAAFVYDLN